MHCLSQEQLDAWKAQEEFVFKTFEISIISLATFAYWGISLQNKTTLLFWILWLIFTLSTFRVAFSAFTIQKLRFAQLHRGEELGVFNDSFYLSHRWFLILAIFFFAMVGIKVLEYYLEGLGYFLQFFFGTAFALILFYILPMKLLFADFRKCKDAWKISKDFTKNRDKEILIKSKKKIKKREFSLKYHNTKNEIYSGYLTV